MKGNVTLSKNLTYVLTFALIVDVVGRASVLLTSGFSLSKELIFWWIIAGCLFSGFLFWWARHFERKTARYVIGSVGILAALRTAYYAALFLPSRETSLVLYVLSIGWEILILFACYRHLKKLSSAQ